MSRYFLLPLASFLLFLLLIYNLFHFSFHWILNAIFVAILKKDFLSAQQAKDLRRFTFSFAFTFKCNLEKTTCCSWLGRVDGINWSIGRVAYSRVITTLGISGLESRRRCRTIIWPLVMTIRCLRSHVRIRIAVT